MNGGRLNVFQQKELIDLYNSGKPVAEICSHFNRTKQSIYWWLKKAGVSMRDRPKGVPYVPKTEDAQPIEEMVLKDLPNEVLFRHKKYAIP